MPRAFLVTSRRYNGTNEFEEASCGEFSPEHGVRLAEYSCASGNHRHHHHHHHYHQQATSDGASECASEESSSECPEELYNLTKLAEVSLAAAAGTLVHLQDNHQPSYEPERSRMFFERIESERESLIELKTRKVIERDHHAPLLVSDNKCQPHEFRPEDTVLPPTPPASEPDPVGPRPSAQQHTSEEHHECPDCGKHYSTSSNLARHRQTHRSLGDKKARRCPHCDKVYVSIPAFSMHVRTHNQGCKCHYCGKCFSRPWLLQGHIRTHTGEKPFKCTICNKAFADKSNLRAHVQTHSNTKPHVCARCGKAFALKSYLYKHEESSCMRSHAHQKPETTTTGSPEPTQPVGSPTSVIVPPRGLRSGISNVIQHTRSTRVERDEDGPARSSQGGKDPLSRLMVARTSVISPNPEHVPRLADKRALPFDFDDPARLSAFSRPRPATTFNVAIAS